MVSISLQSERGLSRNHSADSLKVVLVILVVIGHIFLGNAEEVTQKGAIYLFHMPIFLALSGYFFTVNQSILDELFRAWRRYVLPWIIASTAFFLLFLVAKGASPFGLWGAVLSPWFHLWFVPALLIFSISTTAIKRPIPLICLWSFPIVAGALGFVIPLRDFGVDPRYLLFGIYFAIGYGCRRLFACASPRPFIAALVPAVVAVPFLYPHLTSGAAVDCVRILICIGVMALIASCPGKSNIVSDSVFARESLAIYLFHPMPLLFLKALEPRLGGLAYWAISLVSTLICVPVAISLARRFRFMGIVLGEIPTRRVAGVGPAHFQADGKFGGA